MGSYSVKNQKISIPVKPDGTPDDEDRVEPGPTARAFAEWEALGLTPPNLEAMRDYRLARVLEQIQKRDLAGVLVFDPVNIRYALDACNMMVWTMHNMCRAAFISASGHTVLWDMHSGHHLTNHLSRINEVRLGGAGFFYFDSGDRSGEVAREFTQQVADLLREHGGENKRLAVDKMEIDGINAFREFGIEIANGQSVMEHARVIKGKEEIKAMRCAIASCEAGISKMHEALEPGIAENELWAILHHENIARGGEWIECRILSSGPRTNPWMQEAGPRVIKSGELVGFDTDLVGVYAICADISRTWLCGDGLGTGEQKRLYSTAHEHIQHNFELLKPGVGFTELTHNGYKLAPEFHKNRYSVMYHGVGMCDEFPLIAYPEDFNPGAFEYELQPGMTLCVESYIGSEGGREGVKLEDQVLITEDGAENLTNYPFEERLLN